MSGNAPPSIFCRTAGIQRSIEEGLTHGGIQAQGSFFVDIQNGLLHLATLKQKLDLEKLILSLMLLAVQNDCSSTVWFGRRKAV